MAGDLRHHVQQLDGVAVDAHVADDRVVQGHEHLSDVGNAVVRGDPAHVVDGGGGHACGIDGLHRLVDGVQAGPLFNLGLQGRVIVAALQVAVKARVRQQVRPVDDLFAQQLEKMIVSAGDDEAAVRRGEGIVRIGGGIAVAHQLRQLAGGEVALGAGFQAGHHGIHQGHVHPLAPAGELAGVQRHQDADGQVHAAQHVAHGAAHTGGLAARVAGDAHQAAHRLGDDIVSGALGVGPVAAEAGHRRINDARVDLFQLVIAQAQLVHNAGAIVLHHNVRLFDQLLEQLLALRRLQIQGNALLVAVHVGIVHAGAVFDGAHGPGVVPLAGDLDLDDVGAEIRQHHRAVRSGQDPGEVQDRDISQCSSHDGSPL